MQGTFTNEHLNILLIKRSDTLISKLTLHLHKVNDDHYIPVVFFTESTNYENGNKDRVNCTNQTPEYKTNSGRNVIIYVGAVLSFILIFAIIREFSLCCRFPGHTGRHLYRHW